MKSIFEGDAFGAGGVFPSAGMHSQAGELALPTANGPLHDLHDLDFA